MQGHVYLARLYTVGERLMDSEFQNRIIDAIIATSRDLVDAWRYNPIGEAVNVMYEGTTEGCTGRRLMVDIWCDREKAHWVEEGKVKLNGEFVRDTMVALLDGRQGLEGHEARCKSLFESVPFEYYKEVSRKADR